MFLPGALLVILLLIGAPALFHLLLARSGKTANKLADVIGWVCAVPFALLLFVLVRLVAEPQTFFVVSIYSFGVIPAALAFGLYLTGLPLVRTLSRTFGNP